MSIITGIIGFALYAAAILVGARVAKVSRIDFWKAAVVALLSYVAMLLIWVVLLPLHFIPVLSWVAGLVVVGGGVAVTTRMVWEVEWRSAYTIGFVVIIAGLITSLFHLPFVST